MLFSEVYCAYFNAVAAIIDTALTGKISEQRILAIIKEKAFSESTLSILPAIKNEEWLVMNRDFKTPIKRSPQMPLSLLQKRWLKGLLSDPRIGLFAVTETGLENIEPLFNYSDFVFFDSYADGDDYADENYILRFRTILTALKEGRRLRIRYTNRKGRSAQGRFIPFKLEYSAKDDKFRLLTAGGKFAAYINLARITACELLEPYAAKEFYPPKLREKSVTFMLTDQRNALDRVLLHFSDCRKETCRASDNSYQVSLWYDPQDETEILIRLLAFGPLVKITAPDTFIDLIKERLIRQKNLVK
ncbi:MAG: WYL domain-containing protein [Sporomusaceae bacterium]|nr:WYL domain-containing protein [Sporomusaceae bacterium]